MKRKYENMDIIVNIATIYGINYICLTDNKEDNAIKWISSGKEDNYLCILEYHHHVSNFLRLTARAEQYPYIVWW